MSQSRVCGSVNVVRLRNNPKILLSHATRYKSKMTSILTYTYVYFHLASFMQLGFEQIWRLTHIDDAPFPRVASSSQKIHAVGVYTAYGEVWHRVDSGHHDLALAPPHYARQDRTLPRHFRLMLDRAPR